MMDWIVHRSYKLRRSGIRNIAKVIRHADIVAIQEVVAIHPGGAQAVAKLANELNRMGANWDYRISDPTQSTSSHRSKRYAFLWENIKGKIYSCF